MKKQIILLISFISISLYAQDNQNTVTSIEAVNNTPNTVILRWKSDAPSGVFSLYYNKKLINNQFALYDSELIVSSNLTGKSVGTSYQYEYNVTFKESGKYFFAVTLNNIIDFDQTSRAIMDETARQNKIILTKTKNKWMSHEGAESHKLDFQFIIT